MVQKESETHLRFGRKLKSKLSNLKKNSSDSPIHRRPGSQLCFDTCPPLRSPSLARPSASLLFQRVSSTNRLFWSALISNTRRQIRPVSMRFHGEFHGIKYHQFCWYGKERRLEFHRMWGEFHHHKTHLAQLPSSQSR